MLYLLATEIRLVFQMSAESDVSIPVSRDFFPIKQIEAININRLRWQLNTWSVTFILFFISKFVIRHHCCRYLIGFLVGPYSYMSIEKRYLENVRMRHFCKKSVKKRSLLLDQIPVLKASVYKLILMTAVSCVFKSMNVPVHCHCFWFERT